MSDLIKQLMEFDAVAKIEEHTGKSVKEMTHDEQLAMLQLTFAHNRLKSAALESNGDTSFSTTRDQLLTMLEQWGFESVWSKPLVSIHDTHDDGDLRQDLHFVYAHRKYGFVVSFDTYTIKDRKGELECSINRGDCYFRSTPRNQELKHLPQMSGGFNSASNPKWRFILDRNEWPKDLHYAPHFDIRQGFFYNLSLALKYGEMHAIWPKVENDYLPLFITRLDYADSERAGLTWAGRIAHHDHLNRERFETTPDWFKTIINGNI